MDGRRLLLGDWTPWVRDGLDVLRAVLVVGALVLGATGDAAGAVVLGAAAVLGLLGRAVDLPRLYDAAFLAGLHLQGWGEALGVYDRVAWFDEVVHLVLPFLVAPVLYIGLARLDVVPDPRDETHLPHYVGLFIVTLSVGGAAGALWEVAEWASDGWLGTTLQEGNDDTVTDLLLDLSGSALGGALLVWWTRESWGSVRRIAGENRFEDTDS